jgi:hypothetical protein
LLYVTQHFSGKEGNKGAFFRKGREKKERRIEELSSEVSVAWQLVSGLLKGAVQLGF